jgi:predicted RNA-binding protein with PIN domain
MRFLIDGYNLLFAIGKVGPRSGKDAFPSARHWLVQHLRDRRLLGTEVTLVFDGLGAPEGPGDLRVRFSGKESADDVIEELIQNESAPHRITVVSDDKRLRKAGQRRGCVVLGCLDFYALLRRKGGHLQSIPSANPSAKPEDSTPEETDYWLREFGDVGDDPLLRDPF